MPGRPLPRHLLDRQPAYRELLSALRLAGGYAFVQQLVALWPQSRQSAYKAVRQLSEWGAISLLPMPPRTVAILTRPGARYLGFEDEDRMSPSYYRLMSGVCRLEWFIQSGGRHLTWDLPERREPDLARLESELRGARERTDQLTKAIRAAEQEIESLRRDREAAGRRLFGGGREEADRISAEVVAREREIDRLKDEHRTALRAVQDAQGALTEAKMAIGAPRPDEAVLRRRMQVCGVMLDPDGWTGLTFSAIDLDRSQAGMRSCLRLSSQVAAVYRVPWRIWVLTGSPERVKSLVDMAGAVLNGVQKAVDRYRRAASRSAKERAAFGIVDPLPVELQVVDLGLSAYLQAPGGRDRDVREWLTPNEWRALSRLKG